MAGFDATEDGWCEAHRAAVRWYVMEVRFPIEHGRRLDPVDVARLSCGCEVMWPDVLIDWDMTEMADDGMIHFVMVDPFTGRRVFTWVEPEEEYE